MTSAPVVTLFFSRLGGAMVGATTVTGMLPNTEPLPTVTKSRLKLPLFALVPEKTAVKDAQLPGATFDTTKGLKDKLNPGGRLGAGAREILTGRVVVVAMLLTIEVVRSEERRVGKEWRSRWSPVH